MLHSSLPLSIHKPLISLVLLSYFPHTISVLASPAGLNTIPNIYAPPPPPPPPSSQAYGPDTTPSFALPSSAPSQPMIPYAADLSSASVAFVPAGAALALVETSATSGDAGGSVEAPGASTYTPTPPLAAVSTPTPPTPPTAPGAQRLAGSVTPSPSSSPLAATTVTGNTVFGDQRPIYIALSPTLTVAPDMCPQNTCEDFYVSSCGVRYGG